MDPVTAPDDRLHALLTGGPRQLDRLLAVVASVSGEGPDEETIVAGFDELAAGLDPETASPSTVMAHVHGELGFIGNAADYYNPDNSLIDRVLRDRRGIPLSLASVGVEVGRRVGVELTIVGLPGHVVVGEGRQPKRWFDPFAGGAELDLDACRRLFARFHPIESFNPGLLKPIGPTATIIRTLNNLKNSYRRLGDLSQVARVLALSVRVPGGPVSERHEYATVLAALGRDDLAAEQRELLIKMDPDRADAHRSAVRNHRARRN